MNDIYKDLQKYTDKTFGRIKTSFKLLYVGVTLDNIVFTGYDLNGAEFYDVIFNDCDFTDVYLSLACLNGSKFNNCIFKNNIFRKGECDSAIFRSTTIDRLDSFKTEYWRSEFYDTKISNSKIFRGYFDEGIFSNVVFENVKFIELSFEDCKFDNVKFINCSFDKFRFGNSEGLDKVVFENVNIINMEKSYRKLEDSQTQEPIDVNLSKQEQSEDNKSFNSSVKRKRGYTLENAVKSIKRTLNKGENVIIDKTYMTDKDADELIKELKKLNLMDDRIII